MRALSDILLEKFEFPTQGQPREKHHELWQIDKPIAIVNSLLDDYCFYFRKNNSDAVMQFFEVKKINYK
jgi:hypothetical protein